MNEPELTDDVIQEAMLRAATAICPPADERCYGFPWGVEQVRASKTSAGWCCIGWVAADIGRQSWDAWDNVTTGEGRLK
jgi:hypothetical protein